MKTLSSYKQVQNYDNLVLILEVGVGKEWVGEGRLHSHFTWISGGYSKAPFV